MYASLHYLVCSRKGSTSSKGGGSHGNTTAPTKSWPTANVLTVQERAGIGSVWTESNKDYKGINTVHSLEPRLTFGGLRLHCALSDVI